MSRASTSAAMSDVSQPCSTACEMKAARACSTRRGARARRCPRPGIATIRAATVGASVPRQTALIMGAVSTRPVKGCAMEPWL